MAASIIIALPTSAGVVGPIVGPTILTVTRGVAIPQSVMAISSEMTCTREGAIITITDATTTPIMPQVGDEDVISERVSRRESNRALS